MLLGLFYLFILRMPALHSEHEHERQQSSIDNKILLQVYTPPYEVKMIDFCPFYYLKILMLLYNVLFQMTFAFTSYGHPLSTN